MLHDVPVTVDFRSEDHAREWTDSANAIRPWRRDFFDAFAQELGAIAPSAPLRVLELGSGPGFLAERLLSCTPTLAYVALDFSPVMHALAAQRLGALCERVQFLERNLRDEDWHVGLGSFDAVVTHQAVHELRHKRYAQALHARVRGLLKAGKPYLVCDHFLGGGGMANAELYMTVGEQAGALLDAGFGDVTEVLRKEGLVLHRAC